MRSIPPQPELRILVLMAIALLLAVPAAVGAQQGGVMGHNHGTGGDPERVRELPDDVRDELAKLVIQDYQGRMKPVDTLAEELVRKLTKRGRYGDWRALDLYLSMLVDGDYWWSQPLLYVRHPGLRELVGAEEGQKRVSPASLFGSQGEYLLLAAVEEAHRTPDRDRSKLQRKLIGFDERLNLVYLAIRGQSLRIFPVPGDPDHSWDNGMNLIQRLEEPLRTQVRDAHRELFGGLLQMDPAGLRSGVGQVRALQAKYGADVLPSEAAVDAELTLNRQRLFQRAIWPYLIAALALLAAFFWSVLRRGGASYRLLSPLYALGLVAYMIALLMHLYGYVLRWIASGYAPLSNGFESLLFISLTMAAAGLPFELRDRRGVAGGLAALMTFVVLGISMASFFDPAIGLLVPVLNSYWLNIHVMVITGSYGFLGLGSAVGALVLLLYLFKAPGRESVRQAIQKLDHLLFRTIAWGIALLTVGTLLGGIWANESWGRYWGWDPKETWSLVSILVYATVQHFRWIPGLNRAWALAAGSFAGIASIVMTYFGVNYFLSGLHSYAQGSAQTVPAWVSIGAGLMLALILASYAVQALRSWRKEGDSPAAS